MRVLIPAVLLALAACAPELPTSARPQGVGFGSPADYAREQARREAMLAGRPLPETAMPISDEGIGTDVVEIGPTGAPVTANNPGISDEQSFEAVSGRETIESDAARLARQRAAFEVVQPTAVPERPAETGPNIVAYALATTNRVGQPLYERSGRRSEERYQRACAQYSSADLAQEAFLERGGPERDRLGLDPDGDGFACYWDPAPFRNARQAG